MPTLSRKSLFPNKNLVMRSDIDMPLLKPIQTFSNIISRSVESSEKFDPNSTYAGETEIFRNRFILSILVTILGYFFINETRIISAFGIYLSFATILWVTQVTNTLPAKIRLSLGLLFETSMGYYLLSIDPVGLAFVYPIYLWTILGNGFRFGVKWLALASLFSVISFSTIIITKSYWQENIGLSLSLLGALVIIPAYCAKLINKLSHAKERAETANRAKSYFLASVSHELRTPLNAIIGYGTHLSTMNLSPSQLKMVNSSVSSGQYLLQLIEQLLQLGKSETQSEDTEISDFNITQLMIETRDMLLVRAREKGLEVQLQSEADSQIQYNGPANDIKNLLLNITSNAVKFTDNGKITIRSSVERADDSLLLILSISDTGIGIKEDVSAMIFEPFQQADDTIMERFGGTGLGLAICKQITDRLNGHISVSSEIGQGSCFRLTIPIKHSENIDLADQDSDAPALVKILSLGCEKEDTLLQAQCSGEYFISHRTCHSIEDIQQAMNSSDLDKFDIAILDQSLVGHIDSKDPFWDPLHGASLAIIMVSDREEFDIHKINIQAAFASILPPIASFDQFRKAIQIGRLYNEDNMQTSESNFGDLDEEININADNNNVGHILVVDDNRTNRMVLESILQNDGYSVILADDGDIAIEKLEQEEFDIMLIDVNMPRLNGIEATKLWRHMEQPNSAMPIVGVTADATQETLEKCLAAGMNERITKPVEAKKLLSKVQHYLGIEKLKVTEDAHRVELNNIDTPALDASRLQYLESIGDSDFIRLIIDSYIDEVNEMQSNLYQNGKACSVDKFRFAAHAIKSSANNIGASNLSQLSTKYENITEHAFDAKPNFYIDKFIEEIKTVEESILVIKEQYIATNDRSAKLRSA